MKKEKKDFVIENEVIRKKFLQMYFSLQNESSHHTMMYHYYLSKNNIKMADYRSDKMKELSIKIQELEIAYRYIFNIYPDFMELNYLYEIQKKHFDKDGYLK